MQGPQLTKDLAASFEAYTGRLNAVSKDLVKAVQAGKVYPDAAASNNQAHSLVKVPIVVARYGGMLRGHEASACIVKVVVPVSVSATDSESLDTCGGPLLESPYMHGGPLLGL